MVRFSLVMHRISEYKELAITREVKIHKKVFEFFSLTFFSVLKTKICISGTGAIGC